MCCECLCVCSIVMVVLCYASRVHVRAGVVWDITERPVRRCVVYYRAVWSVSRVLATCVGHAMLPSARGLRDERVLCSCVAVPRDASARYAMQLTHRTSCCTTSWWHVSALVRPANGST